MLDTRKYNNKYMAQRGKNVKNAKNAKNKRVLNAAFGTNARKIETAGAE